MVRKQVDGFIASLRQCRCPICSMQDAPEQSCWCSTDHQQDSWQVVLKVTDGQHACCDQLALVGAVAGVCDAAAGRQDGLAPEALQVPQDAGAVCAGCGALPVVQRQADAVYGPLCAAAYVVSYYAALVVMSIS